MFHKIFNYFGTEETPIIIIANEATKAYHGKNVLQ